MNAATLCAISAYVLWGLFPIYWKTLAHVPSVELLAHRVVWSCICFAIIVTAKRNWSWLRELLSTPRKLAFQALAAFLISVNWGLFIWAINSNQVVESSLGYFINPLMSVALGVVFLNEKLRPWQWASTAMAAVGVLYLTFNYGSFPWLALGLACTFALYGLLKKKTSLTPIRGMFIETATVLIPASVYLVFLAAGNGTQFFSTPATPVLLATSGLVTAMPLLLFATAAKGVPLSTLGLLQYLAPTMQLLIGVFVYGEPFGRDRFIGFGFVWLALIAFTVERIIHGRYQKTRPLSTL